MKSLIEKCVLSVIVVELLGAAGAWFTSNVVDTWYADLVKPAGAPPNWVFAPVWTILYALIGISFALIWHRTDEAGPRRRAVIPFFVQLALNLAWTPIFFGAQQMAAALAVIVTLLAAIAWTIRRFSRVSVLAAWLLAPYLAWVGYATYLNAGYVFLNR